MNLWKAFYELGGKSATIIWVRRMNDALFIRLLLLLFKYCLNNMPNLHTIYRPFLLRWINNWKEFCFVLGQNQTDEEKSGKAVVRCLVILKHTAGKRRGQLKSSLALEVSPNKTRITKQPILLWDWRKKKKKNCSVFTFALLLLGALDNRIRISHCLSCVYKETNSSLAEMLSDLRLWSDSKH